LLKIDCEGSDYLVLEGARRLLENRRIKHIFFEENASRMEMLGIKSGASRRLLQGFGYQCVSIYDTVPEFEFHAWI
jgi:Methyltransferase FkbM domain